MRSLKWELVAATGLVIGLGCGGDDGGPPAPTVTIQKATDSGDGQTDTVRATLGSPFRVLVQRDNAPAEGVAVTWTVPTGQGSVSSSSTSTDAQGIASVTRTLGPTAGTQTASAAATGATGSVTFSATARAGNLTAIEKAGEPSEGLINGSVTYTVAAKDQHGNGISGVVIDWAATAGGGSITPAQNATGSIGQASATRTLSGTTGAHTATATAAVIPQTVTFTTNAVTAATTADVNVANNSFSPASVQIGVNGSVTWNWQGTTLPHNVTFAPATGAPANVPDRTDGSAQRSFAQAGTFSYSCTNHPGMNGSVSVVQ